MLGMIFDMLYSTHLYDRYDKSYIFLSIVIFSSLVFSR